MRDYAHKQGFNDKRPSSKKNARPETASAWGWTILGIALGLGVAVLVAIKLFPKLAGIDRSLATATELEQDEGVSIKPLATPSIKPTEAKAPPQPKFDFYTLLPNMEEIDAQQAPIAEIKAQDKNQDKKENKKIVQVVSAPPAPISHQNPTPNTDKSDSFILQAAVFQSKEPAENLQAQLILQGFEVKIESYQKDNSPTTWYRVYLGPFQQVADAKLAQTSLQQTAQVASFVIKNKA